jgi:glycosyl transferase family 1
VRLGILAYATDTGLGNQTRNIYKFLNPSRTMLVDISKFNRLTVHEDWYDYDIRTDGYPSKEDIDTFLRDIDVVFVCESPLNYYLFDRAKELGIKTVLQYNYEFLDYFQGRDLPKPDLFAAPTVWNMNAVENIVGQKVEVLRVPADTSLLPRRSITEANHFIHIAGRPAVYDRNGTLAFIKAINLVHQIIDAKYTIFCQHPTNEMKMLCSRLPIELIEHVENYPTMYESGDVLVLPRRYGGLCLPAQEAIASGMPVLMPSIPPNNDWLPGEMLIDTIGRPEIFKAHAPVQMYNIDITKLAQTMADLHRHPEAVQRLSSQALTIRDDISWTTMAQHYKKRLEELCISA